MKKLYTSPSINLALPEKAGQSALRRSRRKKKRELLQGGGRGEILSRSALELERYSGNVRKSSFLDKG